MTDYRPENRLTCCSALSANLAMMRDLGKESQTFGHWKHKLGGNGLMLYPDFLMNPFAVKALTKMREKKLKKKEENAKQ